MEIIAYKGARVQLPHAVTAAGGTAAEEYLAALPFTTDAARNQQIADAAFATHTAAAAERANDAAHDAEVARRLAVGAWVPDASLAAYRARNPEPATPTATPTETPAATDNEPLAEYRPEPEGEG